MSKPSRLVIVESPAKARTIEKYLGDEFTVMASVGHIRDLPDGAAEIPADIKGESWAWLGVNVDADFEAVYVPNSDKRSLIAELKRAVKAADELYLASDEDREGEAISWHLLELLQPKVPVHRMVFHEITKEAIQHALANPRDLNMSLVEAQEARRKLDRLYGYELSRVTQRRASGKSAGRVQSVALRLVVDRERERMAFISADYADLFARLTPGFKAQAATINGQKLASGDSFNDRGEFIAPNALLLGMETAEKISAALMGQPFKVREIKQKFFSKKPPVPFTTSSLQQEAGKKFRWKSSLTMSIAQDLYQRGYITYMRTDSSSLSEQATNAARSQAKEMFGADTVPDSPRRYGANAKGAQEAHEAVRPAGESFRTPRDVAGELSADSLKLYQMIWSRTVASQMVDSKEATTTAIIDATATTGEEVEFRASGTVTTLPGWRDAYELGKDEGEDDAESRLPNLEEGQILQAEEVQAAGHKTKPPARYTEPSLIKKMEELGIGRPSTYAATLSLLTNRAYVDKRGTALVPSWNAMNVIQLLEMYFSELVDYEFTASMEAKLDQIAAGEADQVSVLKNFYWGSNSDVLGLKELLQDWETKIDMKLAGSIVIPGSTAVVRNGKYGAYLERDDERANIPADLIFPDELTPTKVDEIFALPRGDRELGEHPESGFTVVAKTGRFGPYVTEIIPEGVPTKGRGAVKPRTASLFKDMDVTAITFEDAMKLMSLPRVVGVDSDGVEVTSQNGRYGPYLRRGTDSRTLTSESQIFDITMEEALAIYAQPKQRGRGAPAEPLATYGKDPVSGVEITLREGRFGLYVTDGETNASLRVGDSPENLTVERAQELLADRRERGPVKKRAKKAAAKKPSTKKVATKKTAAKKTAAKKITAKKTATKKAAVKKAAVEPEAE
jgi:DNA topoisomerase-1